MKNKKNLVSKIFFSLGLLCVIFFSWHQALAQVKMDYTLGLGNASPIDLAVNIINWGLGILALIAVIIILWGGFAWMLSGGNEEKIEKAKKILRNGIIGLVIILAAWGIATYIINKLLKATGTDLSSFGGPNYTSTIRGKGNPFFVDHTNPADEAKGVSLCHLIAVTFSLPIDTTTINDTNFKVTVAGNDKKGNGEPCASSSECRSGLCAASACAGDQLKGSFAFSPDNSPENPSYFAVWYPDVDYLASIAYRVELTTDIIGLDEVTTDTYTLEMDDPKRIFEFETGTETDKIPPKVDVTQILPFPEDGAVDVCRKTPIQVSFSESLDPASVKDENIWLYKYTAGATPKDPGNELSGIKFSSIGGQADDTFITGPQNTLDAFSEYGLSLYSGAYTATETSVRKNYVDAIRDTCGNPMSGDYDNDMEGSAIDDFIEATSKVTEKNPKYTYPWTFKTGELEDCTPQIDAIEYNQPDYYSEDAVPYNHEKSDIAAGDEDTDKIKLKGKFLYPFNDVEFNYNLSGTWGLPCFDSVHNINSPCFITNNGSSEITLRTPVGVKSGGSIKVENDNGADTSDDVLYVASPYISGLSPEKGAVGQFITIKGANFINDKRGKVYFNGLEAEMPCADGWDDDEIVVKIPESFRASFAEGDFLEVQVVTFENKYSNKRGFTLTSGNPGPGLCSVAPACSPNGGEDVTLSGQNFGSTRQSVYFIDPANNGKLADIESWSDTSILTNQSPVKLQNYYDVFVAVMGPEGKLVFSNSKNYKIPCGEPPAVFIYGSCNLANSLYYLPNPKPNSDNACRNGVIKFAFNQDMDNQSVKSNVKVFKCNTSGDWNASACPEPPISTTAFSIFSGKLSNAYGDANYEYFTYTPIPSTQLAGDTWYKVVIPTSVVNTAGVALTQPYEWHFKVRSGGINCSIDNVDLEPSYYRATTYDSAKACPKNVTDDATGNQYTYEATPYNSECFALSSNLSWNWVIDETKNIIKFPPSNTTSSTTTDGYNNVCMQGSGANHYGIAHVKATPAFSAVSDTADFEVDFGHCTSDADCLAACPNSHSTCSFATSHCTPEITKVIPQTGVGPGGCVTIFGCFFGPERGAKGKVEFGSIPEQSLSVALCSDATWQDDRIIAELPTSFNSGAYDVSVTSFYGLKTTTTSDKKIITQTNVTPCLCRADPSSGREGDSVTLYGKYFNLLATSPAARFYNNKNAAGSLESLDSATYGSDAYSMKTAVPYGTIGHSELGVQAQGMNMNNLISSNPIGFTYSCQLNSDCPTTHCCKNNRCEAASVCNACANATDCQYGSCKSPCVNGMCAPYISSITPGEGNVGQPITISGCHFGDYYGPGNNPYSRVTFNTIIEAPLACGDGEDSWNNEEIKVYAPDGIFDAKDSADVSVRQVYHSPTDGTLKSQDSLSGQAYCLDNTCANQADCEKAKIDGGCESVWHSTTFAKSDVCLGVDIPVLCRLKAANGKVGDTVNLEGYNYYPGAPQSFCSCAGEKDQSCHIAVNAASCTINRSYTCYADPENHATACSTTLSTNNGSNYYEEGLGCLCVNSDDANETCHINIGATSCVYTKPPYACYVDEGDPTAKCSENSSTYQTLNGNVEYAINKQATWEYNPVGHDPSPYDVYLRTIVPAGTETGNVYVQAIKADGTVCESNGMNYDITCANCGECASGQMCDLTYSADRTYGKCTSNKVGFCAAAPASCCGNTGCKITQQEDGTSDGGICYERPLYDAEKSAPDNNATGVCPNAEITLGFDKPMKPSDETKSYLDYIKLVKKADYDVVSGDFNALADNKLGAVELSDFGTLLLKQSSLLEANTEYMIAVLSDKNTNTGLVDEENGMALGETLAIKFTTSNGAGGCGPASVALSASEEFTDRAYTFIKEGEAQSFLATVKSADNQALIGIEGVLDWDYDWETVYETVEDLETGDCPVAGIISGDPASFIEDNKTQKLTAGKQEGDGSISVNIIGDGSPEHNWSGSHNTSQAVHVLFCEEEDNLYVFPNDDELDTENQNFYFGYCRGGEGDDLLPELSLSTIKRGVATKEKYLYMYLFTNDENEDLFGIKVYPNDLNNNTAQVFDAVKPSLWASINLDNSGAYSDTTLDGYEAIENTQSALVSAPNLTGGTLYANVYMLSVNKEASSEMQAVFKKIKERWYFNTNSEFNSDCGETKEKLIRDTKRVTDLGTINYLLAAKAEYPSISEGSYIQYFTNSRWPSWDSALGNALGQSLPIDPVNEFANATTNCPNDKASNFYESETCWDPVNKKYKCPEGSHVYQYVYDNASQSYGLYANLEINDQTWDWAASSPYNPCSGNSYSEGCTCFNYKVDSRDFTDFYHGTCVSNACVNSGFKNNSYCSSDSDCRIVP